MLVSLFAFNITSFHFIIIFLIIVLCFNPVILISDELLVERHNWVVQLSSQLHRFLSAWTRTISRRVSHTHLCTVFYHTLDQILTYRARGPEWLLSSQPQLLVWWRMGLLLPCRMTHLWLLEVELDHCMESLVEPSTVSASC